jgi:hypothetical protein
MGGDLHPYTEFQHLWTYLRRGERVGQRFSAYLSCLEHMIRIPCDVPSTFSFSVWYARSCRGRVQLSIFLKERSASITALYRLLLVWVQITIFLVVSARSWYEVNTVSTDLIAFAAFTEYFAVVTLSMQWVMNFVSRGTWQFCDARRSDFVATITEAISYRGEQI